MTPAPGFPAWWLFLQVAAVVLTVAGAVVLFTGPVVLGAILLLAAQPLNVFLALRKRAVSVRYLGARHPTE